MDGLLSSVLGAIERLSAISTSACGGCQKDLVRTRERPDVSLAHVFALRPLHDAAPEAAHATQRGARLLHEGRFEEAVRELHDARQLAPRTPEAFSNLGCAYHMSGDDGTAFHWYREASRMNPRDEIPILALSQLELRRGHPEEAQRLIVNFLQEVDPSHVGALKQLGRLYQREEQWSKAAGCYHRLITIDPTNDEWPANLQVCLNHLPVKNDYGEPVQNPGGLPGMFALAFSFAEPILRNAMPSENQNGLADRDRGAGGYGGGGRDSSFAVGRASPRGNNFARDGGYGGHGPYGGRQGPGFNGPTLLEAQRQRESGRTDAAIKAYKGLLQQDGRNADALLGLADCHCDLGNMDAALEAGKQLLSVRPDDAEANLRVAELLMRSGYGPEMAEPYLKRASADTRGSRPLKHRLLCATAEAALASEDHAKALSSASEAVRMDAESARALLLLGSARLRVADYQAALRAFNAAIEAARDGPDVRRLRAEAHTLSAQAHERLREYTQAFQECQKALDVMPSYAAARVVRATALQQSGRVRDAESELETVLRHDSQNVAACLQLGYIQLCGGDSRAASTLEALVTNSAVSRSNLGAAKVYMALALDSHPERGSGPQRVDAMVKEGLNLHRNLQKVWRDIEGTPSGQPLQSVQRLRGICDLDLTSMQARQLLGLLARATGRSDLVHALQGAGPPANGRGQSVPPNRWAPIGSSGMRGAHSGACTPNGNERGGALGGGGWRNSPGEARGRGRSGSATPADHYGSGYNTPHGPGMRGRNMGSRDQSPMPGGGSSGMGDPLTIGWNELIRPEQLNFGPQLGAGGSAAVFRGSWNGQEVAIKKISGVAHLEEMRKEINALRRLRHPRLVRFIGACVQPPLLLVVTEFMSGGSLHDRLFGSRRGQPLPPRQKHLISCQMAEGMTFLHSQRVVHRDLKSMNILLDAQESAKICDFGLAHQMDSQATHIARKIDGEEGGSPRYMAPECYDANNGKLTEKVDIWAMGCILIELFGGVLPYADCTTMAQLSARILVERRPPDVHPSVPVPIANIIRRCVNFDPSRRPTSQELQGEIQMLR